MPVRGALGALSFAAVSGFAVVFFFCFWASGCTLRRSTTPMPTITLTVKMYIGRGYCMVETSGAPLRIILAKKLPMPKAVADFSTSKMRAFAAMNRM